MKEKERDFGMLGCEKEIWSYIWFHFHMEFSECG